MVWNLELGSDLISHHSPYIALGCVVFLITLRWANVSRHRYLKDIFQLPSKETFPRAGRDRWWHDYLTRHLGGWGRAGCQSCSPAETDKTFVKESLHQHNTGKQTRQIFLILWILQLGMGMSSESQNSFCKAHAKCCVWFTPSRELFLWNMDWLLPTLSHRLLLHMDRCFQPKVLKVHCHLSSLRPYHDSDGKMKLGERRHTPSNP